MSLVVSPDDHGLRSPSLLPPPSLCEYRGVFPVLEVLTEPLSELAWGHLGPRQPPRPPATDPIIVDPIA